jgi:hypothetical protein
LDVGLLPADEPPARGISLRPLHHLKVTVRAYTAVRRDRSAWPPLALMLRLLGAEACLREPAPGVRT